MIIFSSQSFSKHLLWSDIVCVGSDKLDATEILDARPLLLERFETLCVLGEGAAGAVYKVKDRKNNDEIVALKVLVNQTAFDEHTKRRFKEEWLIGSKLVHKNIVQAYDLIELDDAVAYTMEYVEGKDLSRLLHISRNDPKVVEQIFAQLLSALQFLHKNGVLHRDIKLENVLVDKEGNVKLSDLGLMKIKREDKLTRTGVLLGTAQYMPPEYIRQSRYDERGEVYAVGVLLYEMLSGVRWMADMAGNEIIQKLVSCNFKFPAIEGTHISQKFHYLLQRSLHPDPEQRIDSMKTFREVLLRANEDFVLEETEEAPLSALDPTAETLQLASSQISGQRTPLQLVAVLSVCLLIGTVGTALFRLGYFAAAPSLATGTYSATFESKEVRETFKLQVGKAGGFLLSKRFCEQGLLSLNEKKLNCGDKSYRVVVRKSDKGLNLELYRHFISRGTLTVSK